MTYEKFNSKLFLVSFYNDKHGNSFHTRCWQLTSPEPNREGRWSETRHYGSCTLRSRDGRKGTVAETPELFCRLLGNHLPVFLQKRRGALERHNREQGLPRSNRSIFQNSVPSLRPSIRGRVVSAWWLIYPSWVWRGRGFDTHGWMTTSVSECFP